MQFETYKNFGSVKIVYPDDSTEHVLESGGRLRTRGQSSLAIPACMGANTVPFLLDFNHVDPDQTLFGVEKGYLRHHMSDPSFIREYSVHRTLAR